MREGHSGSHVAREGPLVLKRSTYLLSLPEAEYGRRAGFLSELSLRYAHMPRISFRGHRTMVMGYVGGAEGPAALEPTRLGQALRALHRLDVREAPPLETGFRWLADLARKNLDRVGHDLDLPISGLLALDDDCLVHGEPSNVLRADGGVPCFIDWDQCGVGSRYKDLGHIYRTSPSPRFFELFVEGYADATIDIGLVVSAAGLELIAAARWADFDTRLHRGLELLG